MTTPIDLRSDTVTRPTGAMRAAMAAAPVGDALSLLCRGRLSVNSMRSLSSSRATLWLTYSLPLSA